MIQQAQDLKYRQTAVGTKDLWVNWEKIIVSYGGNYCLQE